MILHVLYADARMAVGCGHLILFFRSQRAGCVDFTFFDPQSDCVMTEHICNVFTGGLV